MIVLNSNALYRCILCIEIDNRISGERASRLRDVAGRCRIDIGRLPHAAGIYEYLAVDLNVARDVTVRAQDDLGVNRTGSATNVLIRRLYEPAVFDVFEQIGVIVVWTTVKRNDIAVEFERGW